MAATLIGFDFSALAAHLPYEAGDGAGFGETLRKGAKRRMRIERRSGDFYADILLRHAAQPPLKGDMKAIS